MRALPSLLLSLLGLGIAAAASSCGHPGGRAGQDRASADPPTGSAPAVRYSYRRGVVVNHWLASNYDEVHSYGGAWFDREDVGWIAGHGFDHIRMRVSATDWLRPDGTLDPERLAPLDAAVAWTEAERLGLIVALTSFPGSPPPRRGETIDLGEPAPVASAARTWGLLARRYAAAGDHLRFELVHRPTTRTPEGLARLNRAALAAVREADRRRFVYLTTQDMRLDLVAAGTLPDDPRVGLALHLHEPESEVGVDPTRLAVWAERAARSAPGREIYVAEFGVYYLADAASQRSYIAAVRAALDRHRLAWSVYDYESGCRMRGSDGTPTVAYEALGLGPAASETRFAVMEGGKAIGHARLRVDGRVLGMRYPLGEGRARTSSLVLDGDGMPARYDSRTHPVADDWEAATIDVTFRRPAGRRTATYYVPVHDDPLALAVMARWLVERPGARLALEPRGEVTAEIAGTLEVDGERVTQVILRGLDLDPVPVWLDAARRPFAVIDGDAGLVVERHAASFAALAAAQEAALARRAEAGSARLVRRPERGILVRQLAGGVTTVREMGGEGDLAGQVGRYDVGLELDPTLARFEVAEGSGHSPIAAALLPQLPPLAARYVQRQAVPAAE